MGLKQVIFIPTSSYLFKIITISILLKKWNKLNRMKLEWGAYANFQYPPYLVPFNPFLKKKIILIF